MTAKLDAAIERSVAALIAACDAAAERPLIASDFDPTWLRIEMDRWVQTPSKIGEVSPLGRLHVAVYWEQRFEVSAFPRSVFAAPADVLAHYRRCARWEMLLPRGMSRAAQHAAQRERWRRFAGAQRCVEHDGAVYVDLADLLRDALCHWTGHWTFEGVVLDRYAGDEIDYGYYFRRDFREPEVAERFERFRDGLRSAGINRHTTWALFSPSGERVWRLVAVLATDGNTDAFLLESDCEYLEVCASGS